VPPAAPQLDAHDGQHWYERILQRMAIMMALSRDLGGARLDVFLAKHLVVVTNGSWHDDRHQYPNFCCGMLLLVTRRGVPCSQLCWRRPVHPWANLQQMRMPVIALPGIDGDRHAHDRSSLLEVLRQEYIQTARARSRTSAIMIRMVRIVHTVLTYGLQLGAAAGGTCDRGDLGLRALVDW